jgi:hypothetical protein
MTFYCRQARMSHNDPEKVTWHKCVLSGTERQAGISSMTVCNRSIGNFYHFQAEEPPDQDIHCGVCFPAVIIDPSEPMPQHHRYRSRRPDGTESRNLIFPSDTVKEDDEADLADTAEELAGSLSGYEIYDEQQASARIVRQGDLKGPYRVYNLPVKPFEDVLAAEERVLFPLKEAALRTFGMGVFRKDPAEDDRCENEKYQDSRGLMANMIEALGDLSQSELRRLAYAALKIAEGWGT